MKKPSPKTVRVIFFAAWGLTLLLTVLMGFAQGPDKWSNQMAIRMDLGFHHDVNSPVLASELACTPEEFASVFGRTLVRDTTRLEPLPPAGTGENPLQTATVRDAGVIKKLLWLDFGFIICYVALTIAFARILRQRDGLPAEWMLWFVGIGVIVTAAFDVWENVGTLFSLEHVMGDGELHAGGIAWTRVASLAKWSLFSAVSLVVAWGSVRLTGLLASLVGLLMAGGGLTVLVGVVLNEDHAILIGVGFMIACVGALLMVGVVLQKESAAPK